MYNGLGRREPFSVFAIYGIILGEEELWVRDINEKKKRNALWSTKISDGFSLMLSIILKQKLTDLVVGLGWSETEFPGVHPLQAIP